MVSCAKCGRSHAPPENESESICPLCGEDEESTNSDFGRFETRTGQSEISVTGSHGSDSASFPTSMQSSWLGKQFGDYQIVGQLGKGGMGMVFLAIQNSTRRKVAFKVIRDDRLNDFDSTRAREWIARFKSEALAAARLEHEHIVTVYEVGQLDGNHFFSMQYVDGKSLSRVIKERTLSGKEVADFMIPVCWALSTNILRVCLGSGPKKMAPIIPRIGLAGPDKPEMDLVHPRSRLERLSRFFVGQPLSGQQTQFVIDDRQQFCSCRRIAVLNLA